ncbi:hypothetical protein [uncultured phage]|nr:hypothetical protein [uncultured phage]
MTTIKITWADNILATIFEFPFADKSDAEIIEMVYFSTNSRHILDPDNIPRGLDKNDKISINDRHYVIKPEEGILFKPYQPDKV